ncbi:uncharacterized protein J4E87_005532 [Alternaria ethzedia]|uniref:uncharacterized protein n=1 Tax=Alternaria ethzedia TaxID=181014 RepID=UPI0020C4D6FF|nr:uncharacterized protein J4E87_005532 [Alternaria ethzedia]KAI4625050.1 hypothetical protein J4E87_005532 [Alternaria ethzedia]
MAKGARASSKKANRTKLRARVFGPVEQARAERLHAKLLETIAQPKPERTEMETEETNTTDDAAKEDLPKGSSLLTVPMPRSLSDPSASPLDLAEEDCELGNLCFHLDMDVDGTATSAKSSSSRKTKDKSQTRKQLRRKPQNKVSFPTSRGKGALKPNGGRPSGPGRIGKRRA